MKRGSWLAALPVALALLVGALAICRPPQIETSLYDLLGNDALKLPTFLQTASSTELDAIVSEPTQAEALSMARQVAQQLKPIATDSPAGLADFLRSERYGLVAPKTAQLLTTPEGRARVARRALRRLYSSPVPPLLGYADDPFGLADEFVMSLASSGTMVDGFPCVTTNGQTHVLLKRWLKGNVESLALPSSVRLCGPAVHTARATQRTKREIGILTVFSLVFIAALSVFVFRSVRWIPLLGLSLVAAALGGSAALLLLFPTIHVLTLAFGTTVLGLVIDYSFHWLLMDSHHRRDVVKGLAVSCLTTLISLVPLALSSIPVLRQTAVFLAGGLVIAFGLVLAGYPVPSGQSDDWHETTGTCSRVVRTVLGVIFAVMCVMALPQLEFGTNVTDLYHPPADLLAAEKVRALFGAFDFSTLPTSAMRAKNAAGVEKLYAEQGATLAEALGVHKLVPPPVSKTSFTRPDRLMNEVLAHWTREASVLLGVSLVGMLVILFCFFRLQAFRLMLPALLALCGALAVVGLCGSRVTLFHLLAGFLLAGMSIDYTIFLRNGICRSAMASLLTSMAGFGALVFISFPVVSAFGLVLGIGLPIGFVASVMLRPRQAPAQQTEYAASPLGLEILWWLYCLLGLRALYLFASAVVSCVWACSPAVRRATTWRKAVAFAKALADKLIVMADGRSLPRVEAEDTPDAASFVADVQAKKGVFVLSTHVGAIEVLTALGACACTFHAWMDVKRTSVFTRFFLRHARHPRVVIHPVDQFGMETVFVAGDWLDAGDCLLMAGDRGDGAFRFAAAFDHPVYAVACIRMGATQYRALVRRLPADRQALETAYAAFLKNIRSAHPDQDFTAWGE